jgi:Ca-activated chloride channel homolog
MNGTRNTLGTTLGTAALAALVCLGGAPVATAKVDNAVSCRVELDRGVLPAGRNQTAIIKITLDAINPPKAQRPPVNLSVVLDRSGSMSGEKLEKAKDAAIEILRRLDERDYFSLVIYDHEVETLVSAQKVSNSEWIENQIRGIQSRGNTALFGAVSQGAAEVRKHLEGSCIHRVILLSDGMANVGPSSPEDLGRLGAGLLKEGISVTTVGVGTDYNEDLMARLAQSSDGNTYFVENSKDLARIFKAELGDVLSVVAKKVIVTIECPEGVVPVNILAREGRIRNQTVELYLNQLYGGQEKYVLLEVEVPESRPGETRELATARVVYENAINLRGESAEARVFGRFSDNRKEVERSANAAVQKAFHISFNAMAEEKAISLADKGDTKNAAVELKASAEKLREAGEKYADKELLDKAKKMQATASEIETDGMSKRSRKDLKAESYQDTVQQSSR